MKVENIKIQMPYRIGNKYGAGEWVDINDIIEALDNAYGEIDRLNEKLEEEPTVEDPHDSFIDNKLEGGE
ncbi:MAG: hypothetical protein WC343_04390 [Bacilli bacterium]|jgi:hypothetical protein